jgi:hypothetical protein
MKIKNIMKKINIIFKSLLLLLFFPSIVYSDGILIPYEHEDLYEPSQTALIVFDNNQEDLYLKVSHEGEASKFSWIIPTPSLPEATQAPENLFIELHEITKPILKKSIIQKSRLSRFNDAIEGGVTVHSEKKIGIFNVAVLSANGSNGLYGWLENNGYTIPNEATELFDWYIKKGWYFTAMKIHPNENLVNKFQDYLQKKYNKNTISIPSAYAEDIATEIIEEIIGDFSNYNSKNSIENEILKTSIKKSLLNFHHDLPKIFSDEMIEDFASEVVKSVSEDSYNDEGFDYICYIYVSENDIRIPEKFRFCLYDKLKIELSGYLNQFESEQKNKLEEKLGINSIKLTFQSDEIVYPLKISQFSTKENCDDLDNIVRRNPDLNFKEVVNICKKTNEILLYVLSDIKIKAPNFVMEYAKWINPEKLIEEENKMSHYNIDNLNGIKSIIDKEFFLTKLRRSFAKEEMDDDLYIVLALDNKEYQLELSESYYTKQDNSIKPLSVSYKENDYEIILEKKVYDKKNIFLNILFLILSNFGIIIIGLICFVSFYIYKKYYKKK